MLAPCDRTRTNHREKEFFTVTLLSGRASTARVKYRLLRRNGILGKSSNGEAIQPTESNVIKIPATTWKTKIITNYIEL